MKERNNGIELYRCFCMFGIVFLHCAQEALGVFTWERNIFKFCVDGFAFISGYYGIRAFKIRKILNLYFVSLLCVVMAEVAMVLFYGGGLSIKRIYHCIDNLWFLHGYVVLMIIAPLINLAAETKETVKVLYPFCTIILIWGMLCELPAIGQTIIHTSGIGSFSGLTLAAVYAVGRIYWIYELQERIKLKWVLVAIPFLVFINCLGAPSPRTGEWVSGWLGNYASPFCVLLAVCGFFIFSRISLKGIIGKVVAFVAASMFPVYVIHQHPLFWDWLLREAAKIKMYGGGTLSVALITVMIFCSSILFDFFRRMITRCIFWLLNIIK